MNARGSTIWTGHGHVVIGMNRQGVTWLHLTNVDESGVAGDVLDPRVNSQSTPRAVKQFPALAHSKGHQSRPA